MRYQILDNFLTPQECQQIIEMARPRLERSTGWDVQKGAATVTEYRTSWQMYFARGENELIQSIEQRISDITGFPIEFGEGLQVLKYEAPNGHYKVHWDFFDPQYPQNQQILERGGQRVITFIMYLNTVSKGGETHFPKIPLKIEPREGLAFMWLNVDENMNIDKNTLHEGMDVLEGEKFIMTKWIREREFI